MTFSLSNKITLCVLFFLFSYTAARLVVKYPSDLTQQFDAVKGIDYMILTPQNKITYKRAFIGMVTLAEPPNACDHMASISGSGSDRIDNPVLLVTWGDCHYAQKVKNAEDAGAKMVLVVLNHDMDFTHAAVRQLTINTNVEVLAIAHTDGQKLIDYATNAIANNTDPSVEITYSYDVERTVNYRTDSTVLIDFWFTSGDVKKDAYNFLATFHDVLKDFGNTVSFNPHYVLWECEGCNDAERCISNSKYCDPEVLIPNKIPGKEAVNENLRQICLKEINPTTVLDNEWWQYVTLFGSTCVDKNLNELDECRKVILNNIGTKASNSVERCIKESFDGNKNSLLDRELEQREEMHIDYYPALYVNKQRYSGSLRNRNVMKEFICSHFSQEQDKLPAPCQPTTNTITTEEIYTGSDVGVYIALILVSIVVMALMIYCVRRTVKRQVMFRMNDEISHIVTQYKQFKDKSNSFSIEEDT